LPYVLFLLLLLVSVAHGADQPAAPPPVEYETVTAADKALAARAEDVIARIGTGVTPGREYANRLRDDYFVRVYRQLKGEEPARKGELNWPRQSIKQCCDLAELGPTWPLPPLAKVPRASHAPSMSGKLDDPAWKNALTYTGMYAFNAKEPAASPKMTWKMMWDDKYLYVGFDCEDTDIIAPVMKRDDPVYSADCVEVFLLPEFRYRTYWEIEASPSGSIYDSVQCKNIDRWGLTTDPAQDVKGLKVALNVVGKFNHTAPTDKGYTVEFAVPFSELPEYSRAKPRAGQKLHFMLVRLDKNSDKMTPYAYQPLLAWGHNIWNMAEMELVK